MCWSRIIVYRILTLLAEVCSRSPHIELACWEGGTDWLAAVATSVNGRETVSAATGASIAPGARLARYFWLFNIPNYNNLTIISNQQFAKMDRLETRPVVRYRTRTWYARVRNQK